MSGYLTIQLKMKDICIIFKGVPYGSVLGPFTPSRYRYSRFVVTKSLYAQGFVAVEMSCPDGLHYNPEAQWPEYPCGYPSDVACEGRGPARKYLRS